MKQVRVQCQDIGLSYGATEVLQGVDLDIEPGEFFALLGPSGSGKSTLLRVIAGFARHQRGRLLVDGQDISHQPPWQRQVGMVFQNYALWPHLSVWDNVAFGLVERKTPSQLIRKKVGEALELVDLGSHGQRRPNQLSGGQQQRVALARTLVMEPQVLLLDEPLSNLDKTLRVQMRQELRSLQKRLGLTTVFVTHDQEEAMTTADRMAVLHQGVLQQVGTPMALYDEPLNAFVATFVGTTNLLPAHLITESGAVPQLEVPHLGRWAWTGSLPPLPPLPLQSPTPATALQWSFRPHAVTLTELDAAAPGHLTARVESAEFGGEFTRYRLRLGPYEVLADLGHRVGRPPWSPGTQLALHIDLSQTRLMKGTP